MELSLYPKITRLGEKSKQIKAKVIDRQLS
jgi:hypothetical protein